MSTPELLANYLFLQPLLEQRLRAQVLAQTGQMVPVEGIEELGQAGMEDQRPMVIFVYWAGDRFDDTEGGRAGGGSSQLLRQRYIVVLYIRNEALPQRDARNATAGQLLSTIHRSISGWKPDSLARKFTRANGLKPDYTRASGMYPLGFEITLTL